MASKRASMMPQTPIHFAADRRSDGSPSTAGPPVLADAVAVAGTFPVTIGGGSVVHPRSRLDARGGPVNIGRRCIVDERASIGGSSAGPGRRSSAAEGSATLHDYVSVETGAHVESGAVVGQGSVVGARSVVAGGAVIGAYCTLAPRTVVAAGTRVPDGTVVFGAGRWRRDGRPAAAEMRHKQQTRKIEVLRKLIASVPDKYMVMS